MNYNKKTWGENDYFTNQDANEMSEAIADLSKSSGVEYVSITVDDVFNNNGENLLTAEDIKKIQRGAFIKLYSYSSNNNDGGGGVLRATSTTEEAPQIFIGTCLPSGDSLDGIEYSSNIVRNINTGIFGFFTLTIQITSETESVILANWVVVHTTSSSGGDVAV